MFPSYSVYDKARHLCPYDGKLIKAENGLYISGYVKPFDSEKTDLSGKTRNAVWFVPIFIVFLTLVHFSL